MIAHRNSKIVTEGENGAGLTQSLAEKPPETWAFLVSTFFPLPPFSGSGYSSANRMASRKNIVTDLHRAPSGRGSLAAMNLNAPARQGVPLRPDYLAARRELRRSYGRAATAAALGQIQKTSAQGILRSEWPNDDRAAQIIRSAIEPLKAADFPGSTVVALLALAPKAASVKLLDLAAAKVDLEGVDELTFPSPTSFTAAQFVEEGQPIAVAWARFRECKSARSGKLR